MADPMPARRTPHRQNRSKRRPADELNQLAIEAARLTYEEDLTAAQVLERLREAGHAVRDERDVRLLVKRAKAANNPLVRVRVGAPGQEYRHEGMSYLALELARDAGLRSVLIASEPADELQYESASLQERRHAYEEDNRLHQRLGTLAAQYVWGRIRSGDCIAIGGGRAPTYTTDWLEKLIGPQWQLDYVEVVSLAARLAENEWTADETEELAETRAGGFDADDLIGRIGKALAKDYKPWAAGFTLASRAEKAAPSVVKETAPQLVGEDWEAPPPVPRIALFGVGVVKFGYPPLRRPSMYTKGIESILQDLREHMDKLGGDAVLADVCNHFFAVGRSTEPNFTQMRDFARRLNEVCLSIDPAKLNRADDKVLVAGGSLKYPAILALVKGSSTTLKPSTLITDQRTASDLLRDIRSS
jgi:DNA-binding transcriptional regulator LsrR (DeoR family)